MVHTTLQSIVRRATLAVTAAALVVLVGVAVGHASITASHRNVLRVTVPLALPGAVLPPGEYVFEVANPETSHDVVRVWNRANRQSMFMGLTRPVPRRVTQAPADPLVLGESAAGEPTPVLAWYPIGFLDGHEFIYR